MSTATADRPDRSIHWPWLTIWILVQLMAFGALFTGVRTVDVVVCVALYFGRMFFITAGFHRYLAHRSYKMNRFWQFVFAFLGQTAAQRGALWWAAHHRHHHRYSDMPEDVHSPLHGFWHSHCGWIFMQKNMSTDYDQIKDFAKYPELRFINRFHLLPPTLLALALLLLGGPSMLFVGFFLSTALLYHGTFTINSLSHVFGSRRFVTRDTSRNNWLLAIITMGEGWHNNHHHFPSSCRQGFLWWECDLSWYLLTAFSWVGIVKDLRGPTPEALEKNRIRDGVSDIGMFQAYWTKAAGALGTRKAATGAFYERRKQALEDLAQNTRAAAEDITAMSMAKTNGEPS